MEKQKPTLTIQQAFTFKRPRSCCRINCFRNVEEKKVMRNTGIIKKEKMPGKVHDKAIH